MMTDDLDRPVAGTADGAIGAPGSAMITQVFVASTLYGAVNVAAAIDAGLFPDTRSEQARSDPGPAPGGSGLRRVLVITNNTPIPEITPGTDELPGFDRLAERFDRVVSYNAAIRPFHPSGWSPRPMDTPMWQRHLRELWGLGDGELHLVVESIQVFPAQAICRIFADASIDVYADGLMSYGPTRVLLDPLIGSRVQRLLYADLVPGLTPMLLTEWSVRPVIIPGESITAVLAEISGGCALPPVGAAPVAVLLGQYLSALGIVTAAEEERLHLQMLEAAIAAGHDRVIFKPHPHAPRSLDQTLRDRAAGQGVELWVVTEPSLAEALFGRLRVGLVIGCFSTAMLTATSLYGIPAARVGTQLVLDRLTPYHNSNRIPVTLVDALLPEAGGQQPPCSRPHATESITALLTAVGYVMQPQLLADRREVAEAFLMLHYADHQQYFRRRRLSRLDLPGALPPADRRRLLTRRIERRVRRLLPAAPRSAAVRRRRRSP